MAYLRRNRDSDLDKKARADGMREEWRAVPGFVGRYEVSNLGQVRCIKRLSTKLTLEEMFAIRVERAAGARGVDLAEKYGVSQQQVCCISKGRSPKGPWPMGVLKPKHTKVGYTKVGIRDRGTIRQLSIHRLVAEAFLGPCPKGKQVNHKNGDKADNRCVNLEYVTPAENVRHRFAVLGQRAPRGERHSQARLTRKTAALIKLWRKLGQSAAVIAYACGVSVGHVRAIVAGQRWGHVACAERE